MKTPFSTEQFLAVFEHYNASVFPSQILLFLLGIFATWLLISRNPYRNRIIILILSAIWLWNGLVYQIIFFSQINKAALIFGIVFSVQAIFMIFEGLARNRLSFSFQGRGKEITGLVLILYGLIIYPLIDLLTGHSVSGMISLGLPCPSTIMTLGFFLMSAKRFPGYLLIIPVLWAFMGLSAALNFGIYQDIVMVLSALLTLVMILGHNRILHRVSAGG